MLVGEREGYGSSAYMLKRIEFVSRAAKKLEKMRLARGWYRIRCSGMMGLDTKDSTQMNAGKQTAKMTREAITKGCDPIQR